MDAASVIAQINLNPPPCVQTLGQGNVVSVDLSSELTKVEVEFQSGDEHCHSGSIVQGGFVAGMLDNAMSIAVMISTERLMSPATLELKVTYLKPASQGVNRAVGWIIRRGKTIAFLEGELFNADGDLLAKASSTARLVPVRNT